MRGGTSGWVSATVVCSLGGKRGEEPMSEPWFPTRGQGDGLEHGGGGGGAGTGNQRFASIHSWPDNANLEQATAVSGVARLQTPRSRNRGRITKANSVEFRPT